MRYFFHLTHPSDHIHDNTGVEAESLVQLRRDVLATIREMRVSGSEDIEGWEDWCLEVVSEDGDRVWSVDIGVDPPDFSGPQWRVVTVAH